ncbi:MAG: hypothetical protein VX130_05265, partial [Verrucomicrobiota bacterium]|nr:hypothetical protein [Verrucomicrobiota bacterium]
LHFDSVFREPDQISPNPAYFHSSTPLSYLSKCSQSSFWKTGSQDLVLASIPKRGVLLLLV